MKHVKLTYSFGLIFLVLGCQYSEPTESGSISNQDSNIPNQTYGIGEVLYSRQNSLWLLKSDSSVVSGYVKEFYPDGALFREFGVIAGKKEGISSTYFDDGRLKFLDTFQKNRLNGMVKRWTMESGYQLIAELYYVDGKLHGEQKKWYPTGELHKRMNLKMGREEGMQQAFRKNGAIYANYESRNGRIFGLKRSNLCYELDNEQIVSQR